MTTSSVPPDAATNARAIRLLALDVDGVLTDGALRYDGGGNDPGGDRIFHVRDGLGLKLLMARGIDVALITGRRSPAVERRARELGIECVIQGRDDKAAALTALLDERGLEPRHACYCGDDLPDLGAIMLSGLGVTVADAPDYIQQRADIVTTACGGRGAVRELCEWLLAARGELDDIIAGFETAADSDAEQKSY
ncbi:KdsC family phosphatase [Kushneria aurantia]|uniref:3-deoxy-D-manno-octulosonate 8-phosphate phosphatase KdsC n=1 Tax=Kushneria aurantia TaxID=504092 RepID=A0ABV6G013_9GAMM|nr:HAD hydrolase family protein [Kushneria aurantia]